MKLSTHEIIRIDVNISIDYFVDGRAGKEEQEKDCVIRGKYRWYQAETTRLSLKIGKYYPISEQLYIIQSVNNFQIIDSFLIPFT